MASRVTRSKGVSTDAVRAVSQLAKRSRPLAENDGPDVKKTRKTKSIERSPKPAQQGEEQKLKQDARLADAKWRTWSAHSAASPYPNFTHPTRLECESAHRILTEMHGEAVKAEFQDPNTPETIANVLEAMVVAILSQATSWSNAKRAMDSVRATYGSLTAYDDMLNGGQERLQEALRCGGLHVRKSKIITSILQQVQERHGSWDLNHLFQLSDEAAMQELISYKGMGPKSALVVMNWCLKRQENFIVDTHVYRVSGLWGWRPKSADVQKTQAHLNATIPSELKFDLHFLILQHGRACPACRGGSKGTQTCEAREKMAKSHSAASSS